MPTFVPSIFSSTISESFVMNLLDSDSLRCLSSSVPFEPNRCGVLGYLTKSSREAPMITLLLVKYRRLRRRAEFGMLRPHRQHVDPGAEGDGRPGDEPGGAAACPAPAP